jgi:hypothetical protein
MGIGEVMLDYKDFQDKIESFDYSTWSREDLVKINQAHVELLGIRAEIINSLRKNLELTEQLVNLKEQQIPKTFKQKLYCLIGWF